MGTRRELRPQPDEGSGGASRLPPERLRLIVITDSALAHPRTVESVVEAALEAGAPAIQLRDKHRSVRDLLPLARHLRSLTSERGALFFVNDRLDLALAVGADGVHLGPDDLPPSAVRSAAPREFFIGCSTDEPRVARRLVQEGADYIGCGTIWQTSSKEEAGSVIGLEGLRKVARAVSVPVVGIGGVTPERAAGLPATGAAGCAVIGAVMGAEDPGAATRGLLRPWQSA